jgi:hypothetical protein
MAAPQYGNAGIKPPQQPQAFSISISMPQGL